MELCTHVHDAHVAILMGVAEYLSKNKSQLKGNVMLIFQPAEEGPPEGENGGAKMMLEEGIFDRYKPEVILVFMLAMVLMDILVLLLAQQWLLLAPTELK